MRNSGLTILKVLVTSVTLLAVGLPTGAVANVSPQALHAEVQATKVLSADAKAYYAARKYKPLWFGNRSGQRRRALLEAVNNAGAHGLPVGQYRAADLKKAFSARDAAGKAKAEVFATNVFLAYAHDLSSGILVPSRVDRELVIKTPRRSDQALLAAFEKANPRKFLAALAPRHPEYKALLAERKRLAKAIGRGGWGPKVPSVTMKPGTSSGAVAVMRKRLGAMGYGRVGAGNAYDGNLVNAVKRFQHDHGLNPDGVAGPGTIKAINIEPQERLKQVLVNLERQRWMNFPRGKRHIYVNIAAFRVDLVDNGRTTFTSRTVVGKTSRDRTPEFYDEMTHMVVNPTWHVPRSIAGKEYLPIIKKDPGFLARRGMRMVNSSGKAVNPGSVNLSQYSAGNFPFAIKQNPSTNNALGQVKFMFPNRFNIYLHDTPSKSLFNREVRAFSHGCVRVQKPFEFAYHLLSKQTGNPKAAFQGWLKTRREQYVDLAKPVPVYLSYNTAFIGDSNRPNYRSDIYGRDRKVFNALSKAGVALSAERG